MSDDDVADGGTDSSSVRAGDNSQIEVYGRVRPSKKNDNTTTILSQDRTGVEFRLPRDAASGTVNNKKEVYEFKMKHIFDETATQEDIFEGIGKKVVHSVMEGFNGTIFAYGQTGSGKTYSITGGSDRYEDRGLIPRSLSAIFELAAARAASHTYSISISYLEIYNDDGYDLLDAAHERKSLSELPKVAMFEDDAGQVHMRNIHLLPAASVDEALNLLFVGDTNRVICETPSNDASSRSHCIFTIYVESKEVGGAHIRRSKLHLVDLAGSERVKKTAIQGKILTEALHINLALHYLEQVIVALHKRSKDKNVHIPYRNSMMTSVLRDSLGGNCKTVMIATMSGQRAHVDESISTCRFAARVAMVRNVALINEELDPALMVRKLKAQVRELKEELAALKGEKGGALERACDEDDLERCKQLVHEYVSSEKPAPLESGIPNPRKVEACFAVFKLLLLAAQQGSANAGPVAVGSASADPGDAPSGVKGSRRLHPSVLTGGGVVAVGGGGGGASEEELKKLRLLVAARDNEISILVSLLRENVAPGREQELLAGVRDRAAVKARVDTGIGDVSIHASGAVQQGLLLSKGVAHLEAIHARTAPDVLGASSVADDSQQLALRLKSFEEFRRSYRKNQLHEEQQDTLRAKIAQAQRLGESINRERGQINQAKHAIETRRLQRGVASLADGSADPAASSEPDPEEQALLASIDRSKANYRSHFQELKDLKSEIEHLKALIERSRRKLQADFDTWWAEQQRSGASSQGTAAAAAQAGAMSSRGGHDSHASLRTHGATSDRGSFHSARSNPSSSPPASYGSASPSPSPSPSPSSGSPYAHPPSSGSRPSPPYPAHTATSGPSIISRSAAIAAASQPPHPRAPASVSPSPYASASASVPAPSSSPVRLPSTGNAQADADIQRFYEMRDALMAQQAQQRR